MKLIIIQSIPIDDTNIHLQIFFQHLEQLLQIDLKSIKDKNIFYIFFLILNDYFRSKIIIK